MGEQQNLTECIGPHIPYLNRVVSGLMRGDEIAEDIVQQTVLKALTHADQFRFESSLRTWLSSIAMNEVRQVYRSKSRRCSVPLKTEIMEVDRYHPIEFPNDIYEANERDAIVRRAVAELPKLYRSVVDLCDLQCLSLNAAAHKLGLTLAAVKSRRQRARQKLRPIIGILNLTREKALPLRGPSRTFR